MGKERKVRDHLLVSKLVSFRDLNDTVEHHHSAITLRVKQQNVLIVKLCDCLYLEFRFLVVENLLHLQAKALSYTITKLDCPHRSTSFRFRKTIRSRCSLQPSCFLTESIQNEGENEAKRVSLRNGECAAFSNDDHSPRIQRVRRSARLKRGLCSPPSSCCTILTRSPIVPQRPNHHRQANALIPTFAFERNEKGSSSGGILQHSI